MNFRLLSALAAASLLTFASAAYVNSQYGFSATAPSGWKQLSVPGTAVAFAGPATGTFAPNLNLVVNKLPAALTIKQLETAGRTQLEQVITDFKFLGRKDSRLGGLPAFEQTFTGRQGKLNLYYIQTIAIRGSTGYILTMTAPQDARTALPTTNVAFVKSFKFTR
jgi:DcrB